MGLSGQIGLHALLTHTFAADLATANVPVSVTKNWDLTSGTGANQADKLWHDQRTITASSTDSLDLTGVLTDLFGAAFNLARVKAIIVVAAAANTNNVNVTRPASNGVPVFLAAGDGIPVKPGGAFMWFAPDATGIAVTGGTGDLLDIVNSAGGTSVTYDIYILGASA